MVMLEEKYKFIREQLDSLGYHQPMSTDSVFLVEKLLSDLVLIKDKFLFYKEVARESRLECKNLKKDLAPLLETNNNLNRKTSDLNYKILQEKESCGAIVNNLKCYISKKERAYSDLEYLNMELMTKIGELEEEILMLNEKILEYEGKTDLYIDKKFFFTKNKRKFKSNSTSKKEFLHKKPDELIGSLEKIREELSKGNLSHSLDILGEENKSKKCVETALSSVGFSSHSINRVRKEHSSKSRDHSYCTYVQDKEADINFMSSDCLLDGCSCELYDLYMNCSCKNQENVEDSKFKNTEIMDAELRQTKKENRGMKEKIQELEKRVPHLVRGDENVFERKEFLENRIMENELMKLQEEDRKKEKEILQVELMTLHEEIRKMKDKMKEKDMLENELLKLNEENRKMKDGIKEKEILENELIKLNEENRKMNNRVKEKEILDNELIKLQEENKKMKDRIKEKEILDNKLIKLHEENKKMKDTISELEKLGSHNVKDNKKMFSKNISEENEPHELEKSTIFHGECATSKGTDNKLQLTEQELLLEKIKAERDYYCKEYHCIQNMVCGSSNRVHPSIEAAMGHLLKENREYLAEINRLKSEIAGREALQEEMIAERDVCLQELNQLKREGETEPQSKDKVPTQGAQLEPSCNINSTHLEDFLKTYDLEKQSILSYQEELIRNIKSREETIKSLSKQVENLMNENSKWEVESSQLKVFNDHAERSIKNLEVALRSTEINLDDALRQIKCLEELKCDMARGMQSFQQESKGNQKKIIELCKERDNIMEKLDKKTVDLRKLEKKYVEKYNKISYQEKCLAKVVAECGALRKKLKNVEQEIISVNEANSILIADNAKLKSDLKACSMGIALKDSELRAAREESARLKERLQNYIQEVRRVEQVLEDKERVRDRMLQQFQSFNIQLSSAEITAQSLQKEDIWKSDEFQIDHEKCKPLGSQTEDKESLRNEMNHQIMSLRKEISDLKKEVCCLTQQSLLLKEELDVANDTCNTLQCQKGQFMFQLREVDKIQNILKYEISHANSLIEQLKRQLHTEQDTITVFERAVGTGRNAPDEASLSEKMAQLEQNIEKLSSRMASMNEAIENPQQFCTKYESEGNKSFGESSNEHFEVVNSEISNSTSL